MGLQIKAISVYLPEQIETNDDLVRAGGVPYSSADIERKTGIAQRRISSSTETPVWMAHQACSRLCQIFDPGAIDWIVFCTHTPDYMLPSCSCILHGLLGLEARVGSLDIALSCSGFVYSLVVCDALLRAKKSGSILLVNADNYTKFIDPQDHSVRTLFGDAAVATLLEYTQDPETGVLGHRLCTEGRGYEKLIRRAGGSRYPQFDEDMSCTGGAIDPFIRMEGSEIFRFVQTTIPSHIQQLLLEHDLRKEQIGLFLLHQASDYMLQSLRQRLGVSEEQMPIRIRTVGNTVSATIPLLMHTLGQEGSTLSDRLLLLCGFGTGLSYGSLLLRTGRAEIQCL